MILDQRGTGVIALPSVWVHSLNSEVHEGGKMHRESESSDAYTSSVLRSGLIIEFFNEINELYASL